MSPTALPEGSKAELVADRGAEAESDDFFRSRPFYDAEGVTHSLRIETPEASIRVAILVREVPGSERLDAISPYGYPGGLLERGPVPGPAEVDWAPTGLVSVFARERLAGPEWLRGARERSAVLVHDPGRPRRVRNRLREQIRANERRGWTIEEVAGPDVGEEEREAFERTYEQTMRRAEATERYFFDPSYFASVLAYERSWMLLARSPAGEIGAGAIAALSDGLLHYYLGGTADEHLGDSPFKNVVEGMVALAERLGAPLNLGGGVRPGDGLEAFKRGFANAELPFRTHEVVCDPGEYDRLSRDRPQGSFFPLYRAV
jgi:hypothetical protein